MRLAIITAHCGSDTLSECLLSWTNGYQDIPVFVVDGRQGMLEAYRRGVKMAKGYELLAFIHDDLRIDLNDTPPNWVHRILYEFEDTKVGLVGLGGASGHGMPVLYKAQYEYKQLARRDFMSNMLDAENHGRRMTVSEDAAVLDGFALIVRREVLDQSKDWFKGTPISYIAYDYAISCLTRRLGCRIRVVGIPCHHYGGRSFVKLGIGKDPKHWQQYLDSHRYIYDTFSDVLPYTVPQ